ncbi:tRNA pseudouridine(55) synthase TruB, partial [Clostridioides difficile]|nr:tRNA pseudouridine(55) synthase TruB [Clostridioides difficile]
SHAPCEWGEKFEIFIISGTYLSIYDIDYVLDSFNYVVLNPNAIKYYSNGGSIDDKRFLKNNFDKDDEFVRVYSTDNFLGLGKLSKHNNTISVKSDKMFI